MAPTARVEASTSRPVISAHAVDGTPPVTAETRPAASASPARHPALPIVVCDCGIASRPSSCLLESIEAPTSAEKLLGGRDRADTAADRPSAPPLGVKNDNMRFISMSLYPPGDSPLRWLRLAWARGLAGTPRIQ
jgi:hypothetical protein